MLPPYPPPTPLALFPTPPPLCFDKWVKKGRIIFYDPALLIRVAFSLDSFPREGPLHLQLTCRVMWKSSQMRQSLQNAPHTAGGSARVMGRPFLRCSLAGQARLLEKRGRESWPPRSLHFLEITLLPACILRDKQRASLSPVRAEIW